MRMAYTKRFFLERVREINEIYSEYSQKGDPTDYIYRNHIRDRFHISRSAFYEYLSIPYKNMLKKMNTPKVVQLEFKFED
ncbi:hypothetical protein FACS1894199_11420 [Bacteroidia bacterium]|nr:hypothetical protein FACS1894199_11420 [Bacteroidia bacterium]